MPGKSIFMIHGMWGSRLFWSRYRRVFDSSGYHTVAITLLYHGGFYRRGALRHISIWDYIEQAREEIEHLDDKPIIMGYSMGGIIAQKLAEMGLAEKLVLLAPAPPKGISIMSRSMLQTFTPSLRDIMLRRPFILSRDRAEYGVMHLLSGQQQDVIYSSFCLESGLVAYELAWSEVSVDVSRVTCPVLVVVGSEDRLCVPRIARQVAARYSADIKEYPGRCHYLGSDREIAQDILAWVEGKSVGAAGQDEC